MADQQNGGVVVLIEPRQQADNLRLSRWLHGVGRLIGDQQARLVGQGDGNHHLLALAFGQLIGEAAHGIFVIFNADAVQQLDGPALTPAQPLPPAPLVGPAGDTLNQLLADALRGIKTGLRLLKNHRHVMADQFPPLAVRQSQQVDVIEAHAVGGDPPVVFGHPADSFGNKAFPGAGFAHQAADLAFSQGQTDAIDGFHPAFVGSKFDS